MVEIKRLYHGSPNKIKNELVPKKAGGLGKKEDKLKAIYATHTKILAILMAIISDKSVKGSSLNVKNKSAVIYRGWPKSKSVYIYTFSPRLFKNFPKGSWQWISKENAKPLKTERVKVKDYINLVRKATKKEKEIWVKKYGKNK